MALRIPITLDSPEDRPLVLAAEVIQAGGVIVYPTETIYGIGADALNAKAVARVHVAKQRKDPKPLLVLVPDAEAVSPLVREVSPEARALMESFWPGPLTIVLQASYRVPAEVTRGAKTLGIRVPSSPLCIRLLRLAGTPITSTSANVTGENPLLSMDEIEETLKSSVDLFLDAGSLPESGPSTVIDMTQHPPQLLRKGALPAENIRAILPNLTG
jgi:L-threonylcarbamoyladenylate synthase